MLPPHIYCALFAFDLMLPTMKLTLHYHQSHIATGSISLIQKQISQTLLCAKHDRNTEADTEIVLIWEPYTVEKWGKYI